MHEWKMLLFTALPILQDLLFVFLAVRGLVLLRRRAAGRSFLVSLSPWLLWAGLICGGILSVPVTLFTPADMPAGVWWILEAGVLVCLAMMMAFCNETIRYDDSSFTASSFLGIKHSYSYSQITGIRRSGDIFLYCGRRRIRLDTIALNRDDFVQYADRARRRQCGAGIPLHPRRRDPMNGNLDTPWLYLIIYLLLFVGAGFFIFLISYSVFKPADDSLPDDAAEIRASFSSWDLTQKAGGTLILQSPDHEKPFSLSWLSGYEKPVPGGAELCSGQLYTLTVKEGTKAFFIYEIVGPDQQLIISALDSNTAYRNVSFTASVFLAVFSALCIAFSVLGILVGRHPESYSPRFRRAFYKDSAWTRSTAEKGGPGKRSRKRK